MCVKRTGRHAGLLCRGLGGGRLAVVLRSRTASCLMMCGKVQTHNISAGELCRHDCSDHTQPTADAPCGQTASSCLRPLPCPSCHQRWPWTRGLRSGSVWTRVVKEKKDVITVQFCSAHPARRPSRAPQQEQGMDRTGRPPPTTHRAVNVVHLAHVVERLLDGSLSRHVIGGRGARLGHIVGRALLSSLEG